jgi:SAM-dependent methyltransferase
MANEAEIRRWNDVRWTTAWPAREAMTTSVTPFLLAATSPSAGQRVLDVGCGGGGVALSLAAQVAPDGRVVGVDVSDELLRLARERAADAGVTNADFVNADMQSASIDGPPFDLAVSQFGVMFFDEPVTAFANIGAHLRPGGALTFACWQTVDRNPWHVATALGGLVAPRPEPPPGKSPVGPFTLGDVDHTTRLLSRAGFVDVAFDSHRFAVTAPASAVIDGGVFEVLGVAADDVPEVEVLVERHLSQFRTSDDADLYEFPIAFHLVDARVP